MHSRWLHGLGLAALFGGFVGCSSSGPNLRTPLTEQYALPPVDDPRFSQPVSYPKETLNADQISKPSTTPKLPPTQPIGPTGGRNTGGAPGF